MRQRLSVLVVFKCWNTCLACKRKCTCVKGSLVSKLVVLVQRGFTVSVYMDFVYTMLMLSFMFSVIDDTTKEIVYRDYVDISVAVATPKVKQMHYIVMLSVKCCLALLSLKWKAASSVIWLLSQGLVVPVIRNVEGMNFADIEKAINLLGEKVILNVKFNDMFKVMCCLSVCLIFFSFINSSILSCSHDVIHSHCGCVCRPVRMSWLLRIWTEEPSPSAMVVCLGRCSAHL